MKILIPMAGAGSRFVAEGYADPKPLIDVLGLPMIVRVIDNLPASQDYIFIVRRDMPQLDRLKNLLLGLKPNAQILEVAKLTQGAAETCLLAEHLLDDQPLLIANCDQIQNWQPRQFAQTVKQSQADGVIITFQSSALGNSYVSLNSEDLVEYCAEKVVISPHATTGVYYWKTGNSFVQCAKQMITKNIRTNNEFYVCPVYNELISQGGRVITYPISEHHSIGTPEDLRRYLANVGA